MTILNQVDVLAKSTGPYVEYIFTKPRWNLSLVNPYGHSAIRYTLSSGDSVIMNVSGHRKLSPNLIYFFNPQKYLFTNQTGEGNDQGGIHNRGFISIRINHVKQSQIDLMHQHYLNLADQKQKNEIDFGLIMYQLTNSYRPLFHSTEKGNCAYWTSQGLMASGLLHRIYNWPLLIGFRLFMENYRSNRENLNIISYQSINPQKKSEVAWVYPFYGFWHKSVQPHLWNLDQFANIIVKPTTNSFIVESNDNAKNLWKNVYDKFCDQYNFSNKI